MTKSQKKKLIIIIAIPILLVITIILCISPIAKYLIQKYDTKFLGREVTIDWAYVNPFNGYVHLENLKIYEAKSDSIFLSADGLSLNFTMHKLINATYEISDIKLTRPIGYIKQNKKTLNFDDIIALFAPKKNKAPKKQLHLNLLDIKIIEGEFHYLEEQIPINYFIKNVNIESSGKWWDKDTLEAQFTFLPGIGKGKVKGNCTINLENLNYRMAVLINKFDLDFLKQYLDDLANYGSFRLSLEADFKANGNFKDKQNLNASGLFSLSDFHLGKNPKEDYTSFKKLIVSINELSPKNHKYLFDSIALIEPFFKYEKYDSLDNVQTMFGKKGSKITNVAADNTEFNLVIEIARYVKVLAQNFLRSNYNINRLAVYRGRLIYNDYSLSEKFSVALNPINIYADSVEKNHRRVSANLVSGIKPYGNTNIRLSINPNDSSTFNLFYHFQKVPASLLNPYLVAYTSFPLDRGTIELKGNWNVKTGNIASYNRLTIIDPRVSSRSSSKSNRWLPMNVIMALTRERGNVIDYEVPISGNLNDPKFHLRDVIFDLVTNIFIKPVTTPYRMQVRNIETEIEHSMAFKWELHNTELNRKQEKFVNKLVDFLEDNPTATISISPKLFQEKEMEYLLFYEAKKKFFLKTSAKKNAAFSESDSIYVDKLSVKDPAFNLFIRSQINDSLLFTLQEKCLRLFTDKELKQKYAQLNQQRKLNFMEEFKDKKTAAQISFDPAQSLTPYNGFSYYELHYNGTFPESLIEAYNEMSELNKEAPRKKFLEKRRNNKNSFSKLKKQQNKS